MLKLDHLVVVAPSLEAGAAHILETTGVTMGDGGAHREMGTHNKLARLGADVFLETIALDPAGAPPLRKRWFDMSDAEASAENWAQGRRLAGIVMRLDDLNRIPDFLREEFGAPVSVSRGLLRWDITLRADGRWPMDGALPVLIDWGPRGAPTASMADSGAHLKKLILETREADRVTQLYRALGVNASRSARECKGEDTPIEVRPGERPRWRALLQTPDGERELT
jgi:hypothetical protein